MVKATMTKRTRVREWTLAGYGSEGKTTWGKTEADLEKAGGDLKTRCAEAYGGALAAIAAGDYRVPLDGKLFWIPYGWVAPS